ncbi:MAG: hypothetical protein WBG30_08890 [Psychrilyobacter sp.]|uniref:hypothetical protein n=1 Tax=Psychrilyobacter sp. TaxID=2586924 RepID=UPI003C750C94
MKVKIYEQYTEDFKQSFYCEKVIFHKNEITLVTELGTERKIDSLNEYIELDHKLLSKA